ncbi:MAG: hypothetical protein ABIY38_07880 [Rhodococcus sp. (in: high G+C Gram-positive bacteria)]
MTPDEADKIFGTFDTSTDPWRYFPKMFNVFAGVNTLANLEGALQVLKDRADA